MPRSNREALLKAKRKGRRKAENEYAPSPPQCSNCGKKLRRINGKAEYCSCHYGRYDTPQKPKWKRFAKSLLKTK
jgi:hypothetical protein